MNDIVLHSNDPYLLMRMFTDLMMSGKYENDVVWNMYRDPFTGHLYLDTREDELSFFRIRMSNENNIKLTERNYIKILTKLTS